MKDNTPKLPTHRENFDPFDLASPEPGLVKKVLTLWATTYGVHEAKDGLQEVALLDIDDCALGPMVSIRDFCLGAMEGTMKVGQQMFNFAGTNPTFHVDCSRFFQHDVGYSRFRETNAPFGDGTDGFDLVPNRTVAADPNFIPLKRILFIPEAHGHVLPNGSIHDGYFFVADIGGLIKGNHIDIFNGVEEAGFRFVSSTPSKQFEAFVVEDAEMVDFLLRLHLR